MKKTIVNDEVYVRSEDVAKLLNDTLGLNDSISREKAQYLIRDLQPCHFKPGDRVNHIQNGYGIVRIHEPLGNRTYVSFGNPTYLDRLDQHALPIQQIGDGHWCDPRNLTLIEHLPPPLFKVGDKVKAIHTNISLSSGVVYEIKLHTYENPATHYYASISNYGQWFIKIRQQHKGYDHTTSFHPQDYFAADTDNNPYQTAIAHLGD